MINGTMASDIVAAFVPGSGEWFVGASSLAVLLVSAALAMYLRPSSSKNLPPGPAPLPVLGNLLSLGTSPHLALQKLAEKYGSVMMVYFGGTPTVVLSDPEVGARRWRLMMYFEVRNGVFE